MEIISGFLLWTADILGVKWVRDEKSKVKKVMKSFIFLIAGILLTMLYFTIFS